MSTAPAFPQALSMTELAAMASAIQWAGHFAERDGCASGGPAFDDVRRATRALEDRGLVVFHSLAVRTKLDEIGASTSVGQTIPQITGVAA